MNLSPFFYAGRSTGLNKWLAHHDRSSKIPVMIPEPTGLSGLSLIRNTARTGGSAQAIGAANLSPAARAKLHREDGPTEFTVPLETQKWEAVLYDPCHFRYLPPPLFKKLLKEMRMGMNIFGGYHSDKALALETDRSTGRRFAARIDGLKELRSTVISDLNNDAFVAARAHIGGQFVVVKYLKLHFVGIMEWEQLRAQLPSLLKKGAVSLERYVEGRRELNLCFFINTHAWLPVSEPRVQPLALLIEENKLLTNNTGGKSGTTWAVHQVLDDKLLAKHPEIQRVVNGLKTAVSKSGIDFAGWVDISVMVGDDGEFYFTEFMVRNACSNWATLLHQMGINYFDLASDCANSSENKDAAVYFRTSHSFSEELYSLPLPSSDDHLDYWTTAGVDQIMGTEDYTVLDLLDETSQTFDGKRWFVGSGIQRVGVVSTVLDSKLDIYALLVADKLRPALQRMVPLSHRIFVNGLCSEIPSLGYRSIGT